MTTTTLRGGGCAGLLTAAAAADSNFFPGTAAAVAVGKERVGGGDFDVPERGTAAEARGIRLRVLY